MVMVVVVVTLLMVFLGRSHVCSYGIGKTIIIHDALRGPSLQELQWSPLLPGSWPANSNAVQSIQQASTCL